MIRKLIILFLFILCYNSNSFELDYKVLSFLSSNDSLTKVEFLYSIETITIESFGSQDIDLSKYKFELKLKKPNNEFISESWNLDYILKKDDNYELLFDRRIYYLKPFKYPAELKVIYNNQVILEKQFFFDISNYNKKLPMISDIDLAYVLKKTDSITTETLFDRNGYYVLSNSSAISTGINNRIDFYYELYNMKSNSNDGIMIDYKVLDGTKNIWYQKNKVIYTLSDAFLDVGYIEIDTLKNGSYTLEISVTSLNDFKQIASKKSKFYLLDNNREFITPSTFVESLSFEKSPFAIMTDEKIIEMFKKSKPILTSYEKEEFERLSSLQGKRRALFKYWQNRDPDTTTAYNEALEKYEKRVNFAETYFISGMSKNGWDSDRGYVLLKYGFPTQRDQFPSRGDQRAAEEWFYSELNGGSFFYFVDVSRNSNFILVHSTIPEEIQNFNWFDEYNTAIEDDGSQRYRNNRINQDMRR